MTALLSVCTNIFGYVLMLLTMMGNLYFFLSVVLGRTVGYFFTGSEFLTQVRIQADERQQTDMLLAANDSPLPVKPTLASRDLSV